MANDIVKQKQKTKTDRLGNQVTKEKVKYADGNKYKAKTIKNNKGGVAVKVKDKNGKRVYTNKFGGVGNDNNWTPTNKDYKAIKYGARELKRGGKLSKKC